MKITPILDTRVKRKSGLYPIYVRISDGGKERLLKTGYRIDPVYWSENAVKKNHPQASVINARIYDLISSITHKAAEDELAGRTFRIELAGTNKRSFSFIDYVFDKAIEYEKKKMPVMVNKCMKMVREMRAVFGMLDFDQVDHSAVSKLDIYMSQSENTSNTKYAKMKFYRQMMEMATKEKKHSGDNPFKEYKIKQTAVVKDSLTGEEIKKLEEFPLSGPVDLARDLFLFSFYCKGQRFGDCITLERKNIKEGRIFFLTDKSGKAVSVKIHPRLQAILDKYPKGKMLFPILEGPIKDPFERLRTTGIHNVIINRNLKLAAALAGIEKKITMHMARHTFARELMKVTDSIHVIKDALAHSKYSTTEIYLRSLGDNYLDGEMEKLYG